MIPKFRSQWAVLALCLSLLGGVASGSWGETAVEVATETPVATATSKVKALVADRSLAKDLKVSPKRPVEIDSDQLSYERVSGLTHFQGNVKVRHEPTLMDADEVRAVSGNRQAVAEGQVKVVDSGMMVTLICGQLEYKDQMRYITAHEAPWMATVDKEGKPVTLESRQMEFFSDQHMAIANQNVKMKHEQAEGVAGRATFLQDEGRLVLEDEPKVTNPNGNITGRRITAYLDDDRFVAEGNVEATFYPTPQDPAKGKKGAVPPSGSGSKPSAAKGGSEVAPIFTPVASPVPSPSAP